MERSTLSLRVSSRRKTRVGIAERERTVNPAYSAYFLGKGDKIVERYFKARSLTDAKRQMQAYARAHKLRPTSAWELRHLTRAGRRFAGEWARPLTREGNPMANWLSNPHRHRRRDHRHNDPAHRRRHRHGYHRRNRHNPLSIAGAMNRPMEYAQQAVFGLAGAYGVVIGGNFVGSFFPQLYQDVTITGKAVRGLTRAGVAWAVNTFTGGMDAGNRAALQVGAAVGIVGSFVLDLLGTTFALGARDQTQTIAGILGPIGIVPQPAGVMGTGAYVPMRRAGVGVQGLRAYVPGHRAGVGRNQVAGLGEVALGMGDALLYSSFRR